MRMPSKPAFGGSGMDKARAIAAWVDAHVQPVAFTPERWARMGYRTPAQILRSGKSIATFACLEKTAVTAALLKENGFDAHIVSERVHQEGKPLFVHFLLEGTDGKVKFTVNHRTLVTHVLEGWAKDRHAEQLSFPMGGNKEVVHERVLRQPIPKDAMGRNAFALAGIQGKRHYFELVGVSARTFHRFAKSQSDQRIIERVQRVRARNRPKP